MRNLTELKIRQLGRREMPPPTPDQLSLVESLLGTKLPSSYIELLRFSNGGCPEVDTFYERTEGSRQEWFVNEFFHVSSDPDSMEGVVWNYRHRWPGAPREVLPIANDGVGNLICLDLTEPGRGRVIVWVHDDPDFQIVEVADSFEEFIGSLTKPSEHA